VISLMMWLVAAREVVAMAPRSLIELLCLKKWNDVGLFFVVVVVFLFLL
jgi:hypothetical protein